jgi:3',5'-cyclic AMP phosphodiesterase CpdA
MTLLLHISDPHFGTEQPPVVAALERLVADQRPDVLLLSGDVTQRATAAQFTAARAFIDRLQVPALVAVPGNHDIPLLDLPRRLFNPYGRWRQAFGDDLEPVFENPSVLVIGINSTRRWRHVQGVISSRQVERVAQRLAAASPRQWKLVVLHQPVSVPKASEDRNLVRGHLRALKHWRTAGVDMVLAGHNHLPWAAPLVITGSAQRVIWAVNAGTALSHRVRPEAPNSVNLIRLTDPVDGERGPRLAVLERWDCPATGDGFACVGRREVRGR